MIIAAAICDSNCRIWTLPKPARHGHVLIHMVQAAVPLANHTQGFIDDHGSFYTRYAACLHAMKCRQQFWCYNPGDSARRFKVDAPRVAVELFSEDLW